MVYSTTKTVAVPAVPMGSRVNRSAVDSAQITLPRKIHGRYLPLEVNRLSMRMPAANAVAASTHWTAE